MLGHMDTTPKHSQAKRDQHPQVTKVLPKKTKRKIKKTPKIQNEKHRSHSK